MLSFEGTTDIVHQVIKPMIHPIVESCKNEIAKHTVAPNTLIPHLIEKNSYKTKAGTVAFGQDGGIIMMTAGAAKHLGFWLGPVVFFGLWSDYMMDGKVLPIYFAYSGFFMVMVMSALAMAYAVMKIVDATVVTKGVSAFYYKARYESVINDFIGAW